MGTANSIGYWCLLGYLTQELLQLLLDMGLLCFVAHVLESLMSECQISKSMGGTVEEILMELGERKQEEEYIV